MGGRVEPGWGACDGTGGTVTDLGGTGGLFEGLVEKVTWGPEAGSVDREGLGLPMGATGFGGGSGSGSGSGSASGSWASTSATGSASIHSGIQSVVPRTQLEASPMRPTEAAENCDLTCASANVSPAAEASAGRSGSHGTSPEAAALSRTNQDCLAVRPRQVRAGALEGTGRAAIASFRRAAIAAPIFGPASVKS